MSSLPRDDNRVPVVGALTNDSNLTPTPVQVDSSTFGVLIDQKPYAAQSSFDHGAKSSIGGTAVQITAVVMTAKIGVCVVADDTNAGNLYIGSSTVTAGTTEATDGVFLEKGRPLVFEIEDPSDLYAIADSGATNKVYWIAI